MIKDISLSDCLIGLEGVLKLDYDEQRTVASVLDKARKDLENTYGVTLDKSVYDIQAESQLNATNLDKFLRDLTINIAKLALYENIAIYNDSIAISLADVNYIGFNKDKLKLSLKYLIVKKYYIPHHEEIHTALLSALDTIQLNSIKRLFVVLLMLDKLGLYEAAAVVAQILFLGGFQ